MEDVNDLTVSASMRFLRSANGDLRAYGSGTFDFDFDMGDEKIVRRGEDDCRQMGDARASLWKAPCCLAVLRGL